MSVLQSQIISYNLAEKKCMQLYILKRTKKMCKANPRDAPILKSVCGICTDIGVEFSTRALVYSYLCAGKPC